MSLQQLREFILEFDPADPKQVHEAYSLIGSAEAEAKGRKGWSPEASKQHTARKCFTCPATDKSPGGLIKSGDKWFCGEHLPKNDFYTTGDHSKDRELLKAKAAEMSGRWARVEKSLE